MSELDVQFSELDEAPGIHFAELSGAIDASTVHIFQNQLEDARKRSVTKLIMDISKIKYVNSTGLGSLVKYADTFKAAGGGVVLLRVPAKVKIVIEMLGLHEFFEMCSSEQEAIGVFGGAAGPAPEVVPAEPEPPAPEPAPRPKPKPAPMPRPESGRLRTEVVPKPSPKPAPKPAPRPAPAPAAPEAVDEEPPLIEAAPKPRPKPAPAAGAFPMVVACANCSIGVEVPESGNYKCPRCSTVLYVDGQGNVNFFAPKKPMPIQMTLVSSPECTEGFKSFFSTMSSRLDVPKPKINGVLDGLDEVLGKIAQEAYLARPSTYHMLLVIGPDELTIRTSDHGRMLDGADAQSTFPIAAKAFDEFEITAHPKGGNLLKMVMKLK
jgi:anti-anti-sigma factor